MNRLKNFLKENYIDIFKPIIVLLAICLIIPLALSVTNKVTAERIAELQTKQQTETMAKLIEADKFNEQALETDATAVSYYTALGKDGETKGFVFITSAKGYGGEISVMTAINTEGEILKIAILDATNETPGLGQNVTKENFYSQFSEKASSITVKKNGANPELNEVNAVTGASISSRAVAAAVNEALDNFSIILSTESEVADSAK